MTIMVQRKLPFEELVGVKYDREYMAEQLDDMLMMRGVEWAIVEDLASYTQLYKVSKGQSVFSEGDVGDFMCFIIEGHLEIRKKDLNHVEKIVTVIHKGLSLGEMAMMDRETRSARAVATEPTLILVLTRERFLRIEEEKPKLAIQILKRIAQLLSQRLRQTSGQLVDYLQEES